MSEQTPPKERLPAILGGDQGPLSRRILGIPLLFAVGYAAVGFSLYFSLGLVADRGLGLTPLVFLAAGVLFVLATLTYVEGGAMFPERGGSSMLARHAFNELVSFIAGWAILIEYVIVIALASISFAQYLSPVWGGFTHGAGEAVAILAVIAFAAAVNIVGALGRQALVLALAIADIALQLAVILAGLFVALHPDLLTNQVTLFEAPSVKDLAVALAVATVAFAGIEATSDLAPDIDWGPRDLRRMVGISSLLLPVVYAGISAIALMAVPVIATPGQRPHTALAGQYIEEPLLGVVKSYDPSWLSSGLEVMVVIIAPAVLLFAASTSMLGLSRHVYALAVHRQVPSWLGKLGKRRSTPHVAILAAAVMAFGMALPGDVRLLAGFYAFGSTLAITIAHVSILKLRITEPDRRRPFRVPYDVHIRGHALPLPAIAGAILMAAGWISVVTFRQGARYVGAGWMIFGILAYVIYRRYVERTSLTKVVQVPASALHKDIEDAEYETILVPVFGTELDDDIVSTAGRLADTADEPGERRPKLEIIYVMDLPLTVPLSAKPPPARELAANRALERATEVGSEYETVDVDTAMVKARSVGAGIVEEARRRNVELIVMGAEPPSRTRGGEILG
ncbi:MAG: basic amino acid/polyamine antiporter, family, partial [Solirubrobacterales bacterium]|nr:basic amino acid/polyamine antiporter, family [Solirubrobacterales bacterium]